MIEKIEFSERIEIPARCKRCVGLAMIATKFGEVNLAADDLAEANFSGELYEILTEVVRSSGDMSREQAEGIVAGKKNEIADGTVHALDLMDLVRDRHVQDAQEMIDACPDGLLSSRVVRNGQEVITRVCMSEKRMILSMGMAPNVELVGVERRALTPKSD